MKTYFNGIPSIVLTNKHTDKIKEIEEYNKNNNIKIKIIIVSEEEYKEIKELECNKLGYVVSVNVDKFNEEIANNKKSVVTSVEKVKNKLKQLKEKYD